MLAATVIVLLLPPMTTMHGIVRAESTFEPIRHAVIEVPALGRRVTVDERGYYVLPGLAAGPWRVRASALGYRTVELEVTVPADGALRIDFDLSLEPVRLEEIEVRAEARPPVPVRAAGPPPVRVEGPTLSIVPGLAEADVFRALQSLPAVAAASDFSSALYVRGGSPDQNLVLLDGAPLFNPYHLGGVFAAFDPSTIASVDVLAGAFPAAIGDRLSSAIAITTRDGGRDRVRGQGAIGLISSRASVDGPLPGGRGSYLVSLRRTYVDLFTDAAFNLGMIEWTLPYAFTDGHLKVTREVGDLGALAASLYVDREGIHIPDEMRDEFDGDAAFTWGTYAASLHYRQPLGATLLGEFRAAFSTYSGSFDFLDPEPSRFGVAEPRELVPTLYARNTMRDLLAGADFTWYGRRHQLGFGVQLDRYLFEHDVGPVENEFSDFVPVFRRTDRPATAAAYVEDEWSPTQAFQLRGGVRMLHAGRRGTAWMPRLGARLALSRGLALTLGAGRYAQVMHTLRDEEALVSSLLAYDLLGATPVAFGLSTAEDVVLGAEWRAASTNVRVDAYLKRMDGLPLPPPPSDPIDAPVYVVDGRVPGEGRAMGVEALLRHRRGRTELSLGYALAATELEVGDVRYTPHHDRRHTIELTAATPLGEHGLLSTRLAWATGQPYTPVVGVAEPFHFDPATGQFRRVGSTTLLLGEHNTARLPGYLRLDVAARKSYEKHWFGTTVTLTPYLQIINILNNKNVLFADPSPYYYGEASPALEFIPQLPILPTFGIEWRF